MLGSRWRKDDFGKVTWQRLKIQLFQKSICMSYTPYACMFDLPVITRLVYRPKGTVQEKHGVKRHETEDVCVSFPRRGGIYFCAHWPIKVVAIKYNKL